MPKVSVIIPCYNVERFLRQCLKSVIRQTLHDIEILPVNDGSTDGTLAIMKEFAARDNRIHIVNMPQNRGLQWARHEGIKAARGEWIMFVDGDDFIDRDYVETMLNGATNSNADIVSIAGNYRINKHLQFIRGKGHKVNKNLVGRTISQNEFMEKLYCPFIHPHRQIYAATWAYLYNKKLFSGYAPPAKTLRLRQDVVFNFDILRKANSIAFIDYYGYNYRYGGNAGKTNKYMETWWELYYELMRIIKERQLPSKFVHTVATAHTHYIHSWTCAMILAGISDEEIARQLTSELQKEEWNEVFNHLGEEQPQMTMLTRQKDPQKIIEFNRQQMPSPFRLFIHRLLNQ